MSAPSSNSSDLVVVEKDNWKKLAIFSHEFPYDDLEQLFRHLQRHSKQKNFPLLAAFLNHSINVLKEEVLRLPQSLADLLPPFQTLLALVTRLGEFRKGPLGGALDGAMLCILEIGMFLGHYEAHNIQYDLSGRDTTLVGLSIGLFAAAAVAASSSLADLAYHGAESIRVAFRFCVHVDRVSQLIEPRENNLSELRSWAYVVTGLGAQEVQRELDQHNQETLKSDLHKVIISHIDKSSVGVTGPPSHLRNLFRNSKVLRCSQHSPLPVYGGLCHASNVYGEDDVNAILSGLAPKNMTSRPLQMQLLSPTTGRPFPAENACRLFELICKEALTQPLHFDNLATGIFKSIFYEELREFQVLLFRASLISNGLLSDIEEKLPTVALDRRDMINWADKEYSAASSSSKQSKLAVVGISCRMPGGANDTELFWKLLIEGRDTLTTVPSDRFDLSTHYDPSGKIANTSETPYGIFIDNPGMFDSGFFNMSPREAEQTDPMQRLALVTAYEALEMAGYAPNRTPSTNLKRIGTFYGQGSDDYREVNAGLNIGTYEIPGGERAFANGRINYFFKFGGPSFSLDTACSSGLAAVNAACSSLWSGETDMVVCGGLNVITNPDIYCMLSKGHFLSKTGQCKVWDQGADGYCRADGVGSVVIKKLEDAINDNDNIIATIIGGATNHSSEAVSITHPDAGAQRDNFNQVMHAASVNPLDVSYVELHGTGTQAGDAMESESVGEVFAPITWPRHQRLRLGAVKSNIGHGEAAAGVASLIKVLLAFKNNEIPRHIGIKTKLNPVVARNMEKRNAGLCMENTPWLRAGAEKRYAIVNSFGAHGGNTTLLLEDAPIKMKMGSDPRHTHVVALSAKSKVSLKGNIETMLQYLDENPDTDIRDLSYTTCARRLHHHTRIATSVANKTQLQEFLESVDVEKVKTVPATSAGIAFVFTGQGSFYEGNGSQLFRDFPSFRSEVLQLDRICQQLGFPSIIPALKGPICDSTSPLLTQLTTLILEIAIVRFWETLGVKPNVVIGHSLGEYAAAVAAGIFSAADAIFLVGKRAQLTLANCTISSHVMLSVRASIEDIRKFSGKHSYEISCINSHVDTVISGSREEIEEIRSNLNGNGIKCLMLDIPFAFHSAQLDPMLNSFEEIAKHIHFGSPSLPMVSPLLGKCVFDAKTINANYLSRASRQPVNFVGALDAARDLGIVDNRTIWVDIGTHPVCSSFVRSHDEDAKIFPSLRRNEDNFSTIADTLAKMHSRGLPIRWNEYFRPYEMSYDLLNLRRYSWNEKNHFIPYVGTWTLDKAKAKSSPPSVSVVSLDRSLKSSSVHRIISIELQDSTGQLTAVSDVMRSEFLSAVNGHRMNGCGIVTASIWADMASTVGEYLYKRLVPGTKGVFINLKNMNVTQAQIANKDVRKSQLLQIEAEIDLQAGATDLRWYTLSENSLRSAEPFASATASYEDPACWQKEWFRTTHLLNDRIDSLSRMAIEGSANKLLKNMAYTLFKNVVEYSDHYRGMQSVVLNGHEAFADVTLVSEEHGSWHSAPHWIDSLFHVGGFVMNGSDASNFEEFFYITPGWGDFRMLKPLEAGGHYRSYVRMFPMENEPNMFAGDVYAMQGGVVVGMLSQIKFKRIPRVLMKRLFSTLEEPPNSTQVQSVVPASPPNSESMLAIAAEFSSAQPLVTADELTKQAPKKPEEAAISLKSTPDVIEENAVLAACIGLLARETGLEVAKFTDNALFIELGIDSLMSLVLSEKFRRELQLDIKSSIFLEYASVLEFKEWLKNYC